MLVSSIIDWCNETYERDATAGEEVISDSQWMRYFNDAQADLIEFLQIEQTSVASFVKDQEAYELPSDYYDAYLVEEYTSGEYLALKEIPFSDNTRDGYRIWGKSIYIRIDGEAPTADLTDGLRLHYYMKPADIELTTATIEIADPYLLGLFALARVECGDRALTQSNKYYAEYLDRRVKTDNEMAQIVEGW